MEQELLSDLYRQMLRIRRFEEEAARLYTEKKIGGFLHLYIGQEAVGVGAVAAIEPTDYVVTTYRDHGLALAKGMSARACMAELFGKATGCSKGLGGSMHLFDADHRFMGGHAIIGGHIPLAAGIAFASKYRGEKNVTLCFFGDGAVSIGGFHEGLSLAALWKLPIVFVCENNEYSMGTPLDRSLSVSDVSAKALAYGIARDRLFVTDVLDVERTMAAAVARATTLPASVACCSLSPCAMPTARTHSLSSCCTCAQAAPRELASAGWPAPWLKSAASSATVLRRSSDVACASDTDA